MLWGWADPAEDVTLHDSSPHHPRQQYTTRADAGGAWSFKLEPYEVGTGDDNNFTLTLSGGKGGLQHVAANVAYGDVFLCSGQSNMRLSLHFMYDNDTIIAAAHHPEIRLFYVPDTAAAAGPAEDLENCSSPAKCNMWVPTTPQTITEFSAVCYLTTVALQTLRGTNAVYGLIDSAIGSTDLQSWMSKQARSEALSTCWTPRGASRLPPSNSHAPTGGTGASELWNGMVAPLAKFAVCAILWDQGENNAHYCSRAQYNCLFATMIESWRQSFGLPTMPFAFVQIGGYEDKSGNTSNIRFAQSDTLQHNLFSNSTGVAVQNAAMAITYDLGSPKPSAKSGWWIHCRNKTEVGRRLALQLHQLLEPSSERDTWSGPLVQSIELERDAVGRPYASIQMSQAAGLELAPAQGCVQCCDQDKLLYEGQRHLFEVANRRGTWLPAVGTVSGRGDLTRVIVRAKTNVTGDWLKAVRFAVMDIPQCVLYNYLELAAAPFSFPVPWSSVRAVALPRMTIVL